MVMTPKASTSLNASARVFVPPGMCAGSVPCACVLVSPLYYKPSVCIHTDALPNGPHAHLVSYLLLAPRSAPEAAKC